MLMLIWNVKERQRQRDRERQTETDRQTDRQRQRQRDRERHTQTETHRQRHRDTETETQRQTERHREERRREEGRARRVDFISAICRVHKRQNRLNRISWKRVMGSRGIGGRADHINNSSPGCSRPTLSLLTSQRRLPGSKARRPVLDGGRKGQRTAGWDGGLELAAAPRSLAAERGPGTLWLKGEIRCLVRLKGCLVLRV